MGGRGEQCLGLWRNSDNSSRVLQAGDHEGKGLVGSAFALAKGRDGFLVMGETNKVESAKSFEREDFSFYNEANGVAYGGRRRWTRHEGVPFFADGSVPVLNILGRNIPNMGAAFGAGVGLGVEASVGRVVVFFGALFAQREAGHAGRGAVIGYGANNAVARAAVSTVGKGVEIPPVGWAKNILKTFLANGDIGPDENIMPFLPPAV